MRISDWSSDVCSSDLGLVLMAHDHTHCNEAIPSPAVGIAIDPVCSMSVKMEGAAHVADYDGATHYFCSGGCKTKFLAHPEQYLSGAYLDAADDPHEGTITPCPIPPQTPTAAPRPR